MDFKATATPNSQNDIIQINDIEDDRKDKEDLQIVNFQYKKESLILENNKSIQDYQDLICYQCQNISNDPKECQECENLFCSSCVQDNIDKNIDNCPTSECDALINQSYKKPHKLVRNTLQQLVFKCQNYEYCQQMLKYSKLEEHQEQLCEYRFINCEFCSIKLRYKQYIDTHKLKCSQIQEKKKCSICGEQKQNEDNSDQIQETHKCLSVINKKINDVQQYIQNEISSQNLQKTLNDQNVLSKQDLNQYQTQFDEQINILAQKIQYQNQQYQQQQEEILRQQTLQQQKLILEMQRIQKEVSQCRKGHPLKYIAYSFLKINFKICDVCQLRIKTHKCGTYHCKICDFDRCERCYLNRRLQ